MQKHNQKSKANEPRNSSPVDTDVRVAVINTLLSVQQGQSLSHLLDPLLNALKGEDKGFAHALLLTTLRHWHATGRLLDSLADNPVEEVAVRTTLQVGITQLLYLQVADHAAIHETVEAVKKIDLARASGLINAILRKVAKNPNKFRKKCNKNHSLPNWLAQQLKTDWREQYDALTKGLREPAPMFLRVNTLDGDSNSYLKLLSAAAMNAPTAEEPVAKIMTLTTALDLAKIKTTGITAASGACDTIAQEVICLTDSMAVRQLPDFAEGMVSVQDAHAQLAAPIIHHVSQQLAATIAACESPRPLRLLDACAAPGGKLAHWLELIDIDLSNSNDDHQDSDQSNGDKTGQNEAMFHVKQGVALTAIDNDPKRITRIFENLERLQLPRTMSKHELDLEIVCADATTWAAKDAAEADGAGFDGRGFDAILLDAPCTATGVIRRHPDITLLRGEEDVEQTVDLQAQILENLWRQLNVGGYLLYITCSILKAENVEQMQTFLKHHSDAVAIPFSDAGCNWGIEQAVGRQCLPIYATTVMPEAVDANAMDEGHYESSGQKSCENRYKNSYEESNEQADIISGDGFYYALLQKVEA